MTAVAEKLIERSVDTADGCRVWTRWKNAYGYGQIMHEGRFRLVHRLSYEAFVGPIPNGLELDHLCRNRACINPAHLEPVTTRENVLRGVGLTAINAAKTHCAHGHELSGANLYLTPKRGRRQCRTCLLAASRRYQSKKKDERHDRACA